MIDIAGEKSERKAEFCFLELPTRMENGSARVGAYTVLTVVNVNASFLQGNELEVVVCCLKLLGGKVTSVEGEEFSV